MPLQVDGHVVADIVAGWTGIPLGSMVKDEIRTVLNLQRPAGRAHARPGPRASTSSRSACARRAPTSKTRTSRRACSCSSAPSGVGKTETALALADLLYGGERKLITINMSEYQEAHSVSGLKGSPPGYVGYGEGGVLTEAVRRNPYSVVLLDEVEKAHPDVLELFFQVFDKGVLDDAEGREIDFRNTHHHPDLERRRRAQIMQACLNKAPDELPDAGRAGRADAPAADEALQAGLPGPPEGGAVLPDRRRRCWPRSSASSSTASARAWRANHKAAFEYDEALVDAVLARCTEVDSGARNVDHILNGTLLPEIAEAGAGAHGGRRARSNASPCARAKRVSSTTRLREADCANLF